MEDTIAALATPPQRGAVGVIRISGRDAIPIAGRLFVGKGGGSLDSMPARRLSLGSIYDEAGIVLDQALAVVFRAPDSYTGEDVVELHCHGSPAVLGEILRLLYAGGAAPPEPGEFTRRAFLNGRMDLTQAEAVADLISAETTAAARMAAAQLGGSLGRAVGRVVESITDLCAHFWALVDYPEDDVPALPESHIAETMKDCADRLRMLRATYDRGRLLQSGVPCAIIGKPNTGKSSLLNAMLGFERAIVTEQAGTTRDTICETIKVGGHWLRIFDTAGLRRGSLGDSASLGEAERIGIERTRAAAADAHLLLVVLDASRELDTLDTAVLDLAAGREAIVLLNKDDLPRRLDRAALPEGFPRVCSVSALTGHGLDMLEGMISEILGAEGDPAWEGGILTNVRQTEAVSRALKALESAAAALVGGITADVVLTELEASLSALGELTGANIQEDTINRVFERFCIGK